MNLLLHVPPAPRVRGLADASLARSRSSRRIKFSPQRSGALAANAPKATPSPRTGTAAGELFTETLSALADDAPVAPAPASAPQYTNASSVVTQFYQDISDQDYSDAWSLGGDNLSGGVGYNAWVAGYSTTESITLNTVSSWGSGQVSASLSALQSDGSTTSYSGTYTVSDGVLVGADITQTS